MKNLALLCFLTFVVACGGGMPDGEEAAPTGDMSVDSDVDEALEVPPEGALPLSAIIANFEIAGHTSVTEVEFENGVWEVEFVVGDEEYELEIDPMTGEALSDEPHEPDDD